MSVKSDVEELHKINIDIKRTLESLRKLRKAKRDAEKRVTEYLNEKNLPGVKYNGNVILIEKKEKKVSQPKKEKTQALMQLLQASGVQNPKDVMEKMKNIGKDMIQTSVIKIHSSE